VHLIDTHCHIDLYEDPAAVISEAATSNITVIAVTNAPFVYDACLALAKGTESIHAAIGLHPELVGEYGHQVEDLLSRLDNVRFIGEVGIDYRVTPAETHARQRDVFGMIVRACSSRSDIVMTVHSRGAEADVVRILEERGSSRAIMHWYSGAFKHLERAHEIGCYFSVNSAMLSSQNGRKLVEKMDRSRVLTETDGPYVKIGGERCRPSNVRNVIEKLAELWNTSAEETSVVVATNWGRMTS